MCLAQGHNAVTTVMLEPATPRSLVKHSTTEPLRSLIQLDSYKTVDWLFVKSSNGHVAKILRNLIDDP